MHKKFEYKKSLGQNFISDPNLITRIVDSVPIDSDTLVIEVGPGNGALSKKIVEKAGFTILYEIDSRLEQPLLQLLKNYDNKKIIIDDFMTVDIDQELTQYSYSKLFVIANLPYYITTPILTKFIKSQRKPDKMVVMIQKEVAQRFSALPGSRDYGAVTVFLNCYYHIKTLFQVKREKFYPIPNVDSAVILMERNLDVVVDRPEVLDQIIRDSFQYKRKNLRNNLKQYDLGKVEKILNKYQLSLTDRAEALSLEVFLDLSNHL